MPPRVTERPHELRSAAQFGVLQGEQNPPAAPVSRCGCGSFTMPESDLADRRSVAVRPFLGGVAAATALFAAGLFLWARLHTTAPWSAAPDPLVAQVAAQTAALHLNRPQAVATADRAMDARQALRRGDYPAAEQIAQEVLKRSHLQPFAFYPFNIFMSRLSQGSDPKLLSGLNAWITHRPGSALAHLMRARYYADTGWFIRGKDFANAVPPEHMRAFQEELLLARSDADQALSIDPSIPAGYFLRLQILAALGSSEQADLAFQSGIARFPDYYPLYQIRLLYLRPRWGGSTEAMNRFVEQYAGTVPATSPRKFLYLQMLSDLLQDASLRCSSTPQESHGSCVDGEMSRAVGHTLQEGMSLALHLYGHVDPIQYNAALWPILYEMVNTDGAASTLNVVLQQAAEVTGSHNELIHAPGHNSYVLDDITGRLWDKLGNEANADQKLQEALDDVRQTSFPNEEDRGDALGSIYEDLSYVARNHAQYIDAIVYRNAAVTVAGPNHDGDESMACFGYYKLRHFDEAIAECTRLIEDRRDWTEATYTRARAYEGLGHYAAALAAFQPIVDDGSDNYLRDGAVIDMGHISALLGRYAAELQILDGHPFVFDPNIQSAGDVALAYNNRCFAHMKLNRLQEALADCTMSLKYGRMPDAVAKLQQLQRLLDTHR